MHEANYLRAHLIPIKGLEENTGVRFHFGVNYFLDVGFIDEKYVNDQELINYYFALKASGVAIATMPTLIAGAGFYLYERFRKDSILKNEPGSLQERSEEFDEVGSWKKFRTMLKLSSFTVLGAFGGYTKEVYGNFLFSKESYIGDLINSYFADFVAVPGLMAAFYAILPILVDDSRSDKAKLRILRYLTSIMMVVNLNSELVQGILPWSGWYDPNDMVMYAGTGLASLYLAKYLPLMNSQDINYYWQTLKNKFKAEKGDSAIAEKIGQNLNAEGGEIAPDSTQLSNESFDAAMPGEIIDAVSIDKTLDNKTKGGIDLNPTILSTEIKRNGRGVIIPTFKGEIPDFNGVEGFVPNIINVTPVNNLMLLLGIAEPNPQKEKSTEVSYNLSFLPIESRRKF